MKVLVINGPNINMLGIREVGIYGTLTFDALLETIKQEAHRQKVQVEFFQSNSEGEIISKIHLCYNTYDGIILNAGAYTHYSYAICDAIKAVSVPTVEVHISNIHKREEFRHKSVIANACIGQISGFGAESYILGLSALIANKKTEKDAK